MSFAYLVLSITLDMSNEKLKHHRLPTAMPVPFHYSKPDPWVSHDVIEIDELTTISVLRCYHPCRSHCVVVSVVFVPVDVSVNKEV